MITDIVTGLRALQREAYRAAEAKGFHSEGPISALTGRALVREVSVFITNLHAECSELWEAAREGRLASQCEKHTEDPLSCAAEELADIVIRAADTAASLGVDLGDAVRIKMAYNETRSRRNGGKLA